MASDNSMLGADLMSGLMRKLTSQIGALQTELSQIEKTVASKSGLEKAVKALISDSKHLELALVPGIIMRLSKERSLGAVLTGEEGQVLLANPAFYALTGLSGQDFENNQSNFYEHGDGGLVPVAVKPWDVPADRRGVQSKDNSLLSGRFALSDGKDGGTVKWLQFVGKPLTDDAGHYGGCLTFVAEATEEAQLEQKIASLLQDLKGQVERLNAPVTDFNRVIQKALSFSEFPAPPVVLPASFAMSTSDIEEPFFRDIEEGLEGIITGQPQGGEEPAVYSRMVANELDPSSLIDEILPSLSSISAPEELAQDPEPPLSQSTIHAVAPAEDVLSSPPELEESVHDDQVVADQVSAEAATGVTSEITETVAVEAESESVVDHSHSEQLHDEHDDAIASQATAASDDDSDGASAQDFAPPADNPAVMTELDSVNDAPVSATYASDDSDLLVDDIEDLGNVVEKETALWSEFSDFVREVPHVLDDARDEEPAIEQVPARALSPEPEPEQEQILEPEQAQEQSPALSQEQHRVEAELSSVQEPDAAQPTPDSFEPVQDAPEIVAAAVEEELPVWQSAVPEREIEEEQELDQSREEQSQAQALPVLETIPGQPQAAPSVVASGEKRALIVDDIPVNQKLLVHQLRKLGFKTQVASNGLEALNHYDKDLTIIFMDCDMPVMNGYEATAEIRRREIQLGRHVPIIAMTSYDRDTDKERCISAGMDDYLTKGINEGTLTRVIETALGHEQNASQDQVLQAQISETMGGGETAPFDADNIAASYSREELKDIMKSFLSAMESFVGQMQKAIDDNNVEKVKHLSNNIKGPCASLGLKLMTRVATDIITYATSSDWPQVRLKYLKLKTVYMRSQADLRKACPEAFDDQAAFTFNTV